MAVQHVDWENSGVLIQSRNTLKRELERTLRQMPDVDERTRKRIEQLASSLVDKLLHDPTICLKAEAGNGHAAEYATMVRQLYRLTPRQEHTPTGGAG